MGAPGYAGNKVSWTRDRTEGLKPHKQARVQAAFDPWNKSKTTSQSQEGRQEAGLRTGFRKGNKSTQENKNINLSCRKLKAQYFRKKKGN